MAKKCSVRNPCPPRSKSSGGGSPRADWWRDALYGTGAEEEEEEEVVLPEDTTIARNVANFIASSSSHATGSIRRSEVENTSGGLDQTRSWVFWVKGDNLSKLTEKIWSVSDTSEDQYCAMWLNADSVVADLPLKIRWKINGNIGGTLALSIETSIKLLRNRWYQVGVTYAGTGTLSAGLNIYINGVLDSSAVKTTTGAYANSYAAATLRTRFGGSQKLSFLNHYGGQLAEVQVYNAVLSQGEITELYNEGQPLTASTTSFYTAKCIEYFPLTTDFTGVKLGVALTGSNTTFVSSKVNTAIESISFRKRLDTNTRYIAFGGLVPLSGNNYAWYGRDGISHLLEGNMQKSVIDISSFITPTVNATVITEATTERVSGVAVGIINGNIALFYTRFNDSSGLFVDEGRRVSSDGLTGTSFGSYTGAMGNTYPRTEFYGKVVDGFAAGEYFVPFFEHNSGVEYRISVFKTTDNGANYSKIQVHESSATKLAEPCLINVGNNTLLILARREGSTGLYQIVSTDGGTTWGAPAVTNLGAGICNASMCLDDDGKIVVLFMDRADDFLWISQANTIATILATPTAWATPAKIARSYTTDAQNIVGYPGIINVGGRKFVMTYSAEFSSSRADLFWGYGTLSALGG